MDELTRTLTVPGTSTVHVPVPARSPGMRYYMLLGVHHIYHEMHFTLREARPAYFADDN